MDSLLVIFYEKKSNLFCFDAHPVEGAWYIDEWQYLAIMYLIGYNRLIGYHYHRLSQQCAGKVVCYLKLLLHGGCGAGARV